MATENNKAVLHYPGGEFEMDIISATEGNDGIALGKMLSETGLVTYDPGYVSTGSTQSAITFIDGDKGILRTPARPDAPPPAGLRRKPAHQAAFLGPPAWSVVRPHPEESPSVLGSAEKAIVLR